MIHPLLTRLVVWQVVVVGGGAAGVELALCVQARWQAQFPVKVRVLAFFSAASAPLDTA